MVLKRSTRTTTDPLTEVRRRAAYTPAEREFSSALQRRLQEVLQGKRNRLALLRRYLREPDRLGVTPVPHDSHAGIRLPVAEKLTWDVLDFVRIDAAGGPVSQSAEPDGTIVEVQAFPTKYPHIVIERVDRYDGDDGSPIDITWYLRRVQNQRTQVQINRFFDVASFLFDLLRFAR